MLEEKTPVGLFADTIENLLSILAMIGDINHEIVSAVRPGTWWVIVWTTERQALIWAKYVATPVKRIDG